LFPTKDVSFQQKKRLQFAERERDPPGQKLLKAMQNEVRKADKIRWAGGVAS